MRRRRKSPWPKRILFSFVGLFLATIGVGAFLWIQFTAKTEERAAQEAESTYAAGNFGTAAKQYASLAENYPGSTLSEKYKFFTALADTRAVVESVSTRQQPAAPLGKLKAFLAEYGNSPFAQPGSGFGSDIVTTGRKMIDSLSDHAGDHLKESRTRTRAPASDWAAYREQHRQPATPDSVSDPDLIAAEQAVADGENLIPALDRFREKEGLSFEENQKKLAGLRTEFAAERSREAALAPWRDLPADPTDLRIESFERALRTAGLTEDPEAKQLGIWAQQELRKRIVGLAGYRRAEPPLAETAPPVLFTAAVLGSPRPDRSADVAADVVFAVARGVLYALDAATGERLWGTRVSSLFPDRREADLPVRFTLADGRTDWVLVASTTAGRIGLTARDARTGSPIWFQPLDAGLAGRPLILGRRVYVPLADSIGTVVEIQIATGDRLNTLTIRQRVGGSLVGTAGAEPGTHRLFVPGDARRVFEFQVGTESADGSPVPPRLTRDILTGHPRDALTGTVLLTGRNPDGSPRYLVLTQADGPDAMKVRGFALDGGDPPPSADVAVAGWSSFPAATNGERVVIASDAGMYAVLGVNQTGNSDRPIFAFPGSPTQTGPTSPTSPTGTTGTAGTTGTTGPIEPRELQPSLVVSVNEDAAWVVLRRELVRLRTAVDPVRGLRIVRHGPAIPVGDPVHRAQVRPGLNLGVVVTRAPAGTGMYATAFDLHTGQIRWRQQLGTVGTVWKATPDGVPLLVDENGGLFRADDATVIAEPVAEPIGPAHVLTAGSPVWGIVPVRVPSGNRLRVRQIEWTGKADDVATNRPQYRLLRDTDIPLPALPVGKPIPHVDRFLVPLADGYLYRLATDGRSLERGPRWRASTAPDDAPCLLCAMDSNRFLATDGNRKITLHDWPIDSKTPSRTVATWESRDAIVLDPLLVQAAPLRFVIADQSGGIALFEESTPLDSVRRWRTSGMPGIRLDRFRTGKGTRIVFARDRRSLVCLDLERPESEPLWTAPEAALPEGLELVGWTVQNDRLLVTDQTGRVLIVDGETGQILSNPLPHRESDLSAGPAVWVGSETILLPMLSGTVLRSANGGR